MPFIRESIVTTLNADGSAHVAPLGVIVEAPHLVIAPFHPSTTWKICAGTHLPVSIMRRTSGFLRAA